MVNETGTVITINAEVAIENQSDTIERLRADNQRLTAENEKLSARADSMESQRNLRLKQLTEAEGQLAAYAEAWANMPHAEDCAKTKHCGADTEGCRVACSCIKSNRQVFLDSSNSIGLAGRGKAILAVVDAYQKWKQTGTFGHAELVAALDALSSIGGGK